MISKDDGKRHEVKVQFSWYGTTSKKDKSGAYLFLPDGESKVSAAELSYSRKLPTGPFFFITFSILKNRNSFPTLD